jgi:hypothetical protein
MLRLGVEAASGAGVDFTVAVSTGVAFVVAGFMAAVAGTAVAGAVVDGAGAARRSSAQESVWALQAQAGARDGVGQV